MKFFEFHMLYNKYVMNHVDELLLLISRLKYLSIEMYYQLQVNNFITKLLSISNDYRKKLLHTSENFATYQLTKHI